MWYSSWVNSSRYEKTTIELFDNESATEGGNPDGSPSAKRPLKGNGCAAIGDAVADDAVAEGGVTGADAT